MTAKLSNGNHYDRVTILLNICIRIRIRAGIRILYMYVYVFKQKYIMYVYYTLAAVTSVTEKYTVEKEDLKIRTNVQH